MTKMQRRFAPPIWHSAILYIFYLVMFQLLPGTIKEVHSDQFHAYFIAFAGAAFFLQLIFYLISYREYKQKAHLVIESTLLTPEQQEMTIPLLESKMEDEGENIKNCLKLRSLLKSVRNGARLYEFEVIALNALLFDDDKRFCDKYL